RITAQYLGVVTLSARARVGPGDAHDRPEVVEQLQELHREELSPQGWWTLARGLVAEFASKRDAYPIPELVDFLMDADASADWTRAVSAANTDSAEEEHPSLENMLSAVSRVLKRLAFLIRHPLKRSLGSEAESWMGLRRQKRAVETGSGPDVRS